MTYIFLQTIQEFLQHEVCTRIKLKRPDPDHADTFELVPPTVSIGWPDAQIGSSDTRKRIPGIAIGITEPVYDDGDARILPIQLAAIVYSSGTIGGDGILTVDTSGYHDLLNLLDLIVSAVANAGIIGGGLLLDETTVRWQPDNEPFGDYWLGRVEFTLKACPIPRHQEQDLL